MGPENTATKHKHEVGEGWEYWATTSHTGNRTYSAKPIGAMTGVIIAQSPEERIAQIIAYERNIDAHVKMAREKLDNLPADWAGERQVQESLIAALANLANLIHG